MADTFVQKKGAAAMGINVFTLPRERHGELLDTLRAIHRAVGRNRLTRNMGSAFHRALDAPIVVNYVRYTCQEGADDLRNLAEAKPLMKHTHDISAAHEFRWYEMAEVVTAEGAADSFEIAAGQGNIGIIGVYTVEPGKQAAFLDALKDYAEAVRTADGFKAMAVLRGYKPEHAASYEMWTDEDAYRRAAGNGARKALERAHGLAADALVHAYEVVRVNLHEWTV